MQKKIVKNRGSVYLGQYAWEMTRQTIEAMNPSKVFVLTDSNTEKACLPHFLNEMGEITSFVHLSIPAGEKHKNISTCTQLWEQLSQLGADRKSLLINVGGGVVTDLGGFVACTYQRGIEFINIPTSLLSMVDAAVGGKNGVDLGSLKNQVGIIKNPHSVIIDIDFLSTLPEDEFRSGTAEMIKHGLIHSEAYLDRVMQMDKNNTGQLEDVIWDSIIIKNEVITEDPYEQGLRKTLNYGHTLGHAIESHCLMSSNRRTLLHGEAIAIGMILETYISHKQFNFPEDQLQKTARYISEYYPKESFSREEIDGIIKLLIFDKKNSHGSIQFVLLKEIGNHKLNCTVANDLIHEAFNFYAGCYSY
ncbi:3-dehydroquinate synthase [Aureisphaera galaxeae]|uniref:3-dehydroquinate synthase n=1 Tax=Aureisphaera galaxeae TaxID=1538023 RepID=UPI002350CE58|nr:3-dehydroquinate synthase [Aureisphaera galaxeae]MDC8004024.1 3-dehydroquinate synthase [Aureisphaera galaxeae]